METWGWVGMGGAALTSAVDPTTALLPAGPELAAVLGLGLGLGLLAPVVAALLLLLHYRAWRPPAAPKPPGECCMAQPTPEGQGRGPHLRPLSCPGGHSFRMPIQEEHSDAHSTLAKL